MANVILMPIGSDGDVHPFVGLGKSLQTRGHDVTLVTSSYYEPLANRSGIPLLGIGSVEYFKDCMFDPDIWHPSKGIKVMLNKVALYWMRHSYEILRNLQKPHTVVVSSLLGLGARLAQEKLGMPLVTLLLQPSALYDRVNPPEMALTLNNQWMPLWMKRLIFWYAYRFIIDPMIMPKLNSFRRELGLNPVSRVLDEWIVSPNGVVGMYPEWFCDTTGVKQTNFPFFDESTLRDIPADLDEFLFEEPVVFTAGTAMVHGRKFFETAVDVCNKTGRSGLLLTKFPEQLPVLPSNVKHFHYAPFSQVFPRVAAVVHHGGIGTMSQAMRAGVPQLIMAMSHDQPDNGARVRRMGLGDVLLPDQFTTKNVVKYLSSLDCYKGGCGEVSRMLKDSDAFTPVCELIESLDK